MSKSPSKIGIIICGGAYWEMIFCFLQLEKNGYLRVPITVKSNVDEYDPRLDSDIARISCEDIKDFKATGLDALIIPGGMTLFRNLCDFEDAGNALKVEDEFKTLVKGMYRLEKPIGAFGPASLLVTKSLQGITRAEAVVTVGNDPRLQSGIGSTGAQAVVTRPGEVVLDEENKIASSGGELSTKRPTEVYTACEYLVKGLDELIKGGKHEKY